MTAPEIVYILQPFKKYLIQLQEQEVQRYPEYEYSYEANLSYTFITLKVFRKTIDSTGNNLCIQIIFRIENNQILFSEIFHADRIDTQQLTDDITLNSNLHGSLYGEAQKQPIDFTDETVTYLSIADRISNHAVNMYSGDNYWPGNYSNVKLTADTITLEQINHMNSRSINHKDNYSLRDLVFKIPLQKTVVLKHSYDALLLGRMMVSFSDRSSQNNRAAGDAIQEQIKKEF
jgi:hypothetical protein